MRKGLIAGGTAATVILGKFLVKVLAFGAGAAIAHGAVDYLRETPEGRETVRGMKEVVGDPTNLLRPYKDSSLMWFQKQGAIAAGFNLNTTEQSELAEIRIEAMRQLSDSTCSRVVWSGSATPADVSAAMHAMPPNLQQRLGYLTGKAIGRRFSHGSVDPSTYSTDEWAQFVSEHATAAELDLIEKAIPEQAEPSIRCRAAQAIYQIALRSPSDSEQRTRALHYLFRNGATEPPIL